MTLPAERLLDFHLEHDPDARTVTVTTVVDQGDGEHVRTVTVGRYDEGDKVPTVKLAYLLDRGRFEAECDVSVRFVGSSAEVVPPRFCGRCLKSMTGHDPDTCRWKPVPQPPTFPVNGSPE